MQGLLTRPGGERQLNEASVANYDVVGMLDALRKHAQFTKTLEQKYGDLLPPEPK
jgi:hypothetical protein